MIQEEIFGDMFKSDCQTLAIPVNQVGTLGNGLARYAKVRWPFINAIYQRHCSNKTFRTKLVAIPIPNTGKQLLLLPTKNHWKEDSNEFLISHSLSILARDYKELNIQSLALPKIGCGKGHMDFNKVQELIYKHLDPLPIPVKIYI